MSAGQYSPLLEPGHVLGKWTVGALLGRGGAGTVYEATHRNGIRGAVKVLHPELARDEQQVARFLREGAIANHLEHVGAVAALDDDRTPDGIAYVVFERLDGVTLAEIVDTRAPLPVDEALRLTEKILDVLVVAHDKGIVHRDVKPANVLVLSKGGVKLLDFGLARTAVASPAVGLPSPTRSGVVIGTPGFMPPEQAQGRVRDIDERSDLWAVSAMLYTMLTRQRVAIERGAMPSSAHVPAIRTVRASVPDVVARIVDRGLSYEREARFGSAVRMLGAVRFAIENLASSPALPSATSAISASDQTVPTSAVKRRSASPRPASVVFAAGIGIVFAVGILVVAWLAWRTA